MNPRTEMWTQFLHKFFFWLSLIFSSPELTPVSTGWTCRRIRPSQCCTRRCWLLWRRPVPLAWSEPSWTAAGEDKEPWWNQKAGLQVWVMVNLDLWAHCVAPACIPHLVSHASPVKTHTAFGTTIYCQGFSHFLFDNIKKKLLRLFRTQVQNSWFSDALIAVQHLLVACRSDCTGVDGAPQSSSRTIWGNVWSLWDFPVSFYSLETPNSFSIVVTVFSSTR